MTSRKKSPMFTVRLPIVVCLLVLLFGAKTVGAQIRTVLVSPVPGNPVASGTALRNALAGIPSPSATDRWLLKIEPGIYDIGTTTPLQMRSWVDIEGSGIGVTTIRGSVPTPYDPTIHGANDTELRLLTVEATSPTGTAIAMANYQASPRLYRVRFLAQGPSAWGLRNHSAAPLIEECEFYITATSGSYAYGLVFRGYPPASRRSSILRSQVYVNGPGENYGVWMAEGLSLTSIRDSYFAVVGGTLSHGLYATTTPDAWVGNERLTIRDTEVISAGGSTASYGIRFQGFSTTITLSIFGSLVSGQSYGIYTENTAPGGVQGSRIFGSTQTIRFGGSIAVASTHLEGGPATALGWIGCAGVWDENAFFYAQGACPQ